MIAYHRSTIDSHKRSLAAHRAQLTKLLAEHGHEPDTQSSGAEDGAAASTLLPSDAADSGTGPGQVSEPGEGSSQVTTAYSNLRSPKPCLTLGLGLRTGKRGRGGG